MSTVDDFSPKLNPDLAFVSNALSLAGVLVQHNGPLLPVNGRGR
jgi:hypothetical protein